MRKACWYLVLALLLSCGSSALSQGVPSQAPLAPDFEAYLASQRRGEWRPLADETGQALGLIPSPLDLSHVAPPSPETAATALVSLPATYDLRTLGRVTPVRNQGGCGSCWAFGSYASLESWLLGRGETWDLSENQLKECHGFSLAPCDGGSLLMSTAVVARLSGPVSETDDPYADYPTGCTSGLTPRLWVRDVLMPADLSDTSPLDNAYLKQLVVDYGAVYTSMYWSSSYYNAAQYAYYYYGTAWGNHAVAIVGWDDTFSRTRFSFPTPPGDGAWIVRNSWGPSWGQGGYFYVSYYDKRFGEENGVLANAQAPGDIAAYQYDPLGWTGSLGYGSNTAWGAAVFAAQKAGSISAVATYASSSNTSYEVSVRSSLTGIPLATKTGTFTHVGYHTVVLDSPVAIQAGASFAVVVRYTTPGYTYPVPLESPIIGYSDAATAASGQTYVSSGGSTWSDLSGIATGSSVCIKAFVGTASVSPTPPAQVADFSASDGENAQSTLTWTNPSDADLGQVIVLRKTGSFPSSHTDGTSVYASSSPVPGASVSTVSSGLTNGTTYYYAAFSRDTSGAWNDSVGQGKNADTGTPSAPNTGGAVAAWAMNEGTGRTVADGTGLGHTGTVTSALWTTSTDGSFALSFDGYGDFVRVTTAADLSFSGPFTVEAWVRPTSLSGTKALVSKRGSSYQAVYSLSLYGSRLYAEVRNSNRSSGTTLTGTTSLRLNTWYHVALRRDTAGKVTLWVNGVQESTTATVTGTVNPPQDLYIARRYGTSSQDFKGQMDEVRLHARALEPSEFHLLPTSGTTPPALISNFVATDGEDSRSTLTWANPPDSDLAEVIVLRKVGSFPGSHTDGTSVYSSTSPTPGGAVSAVSGGLTNGTTYSYAVFSRDTSGAWNDAVQPGKNADTALPAASPPPPSDGPVAYWPFDDGAGNLASDASGNGHTGTIVGATWTTSGDGSGALQFDGVDDYVQVLNAPDLNPTSALTIEAWIRPGSLSGQRVIVEKAYTSHVAPYYQYGLFTVGSEAKLTLALGGTVRYVLSSGAGLTTGTWYHLAGVYDGSQLRIYVNGTLLGTTSASGTISSYATNLLLGKHRNVTSDRFSGRIDEVRLHACALAPGEFKSLPLSWLPPTETEALDLLEVRVIPNPVREAGVARFVAQGTGIESVRAEVFNLAGHRVFAGDWEAGTEVEWEALTGEGQPLANGAYIVVLWARGGDSSLSSTRATFALLR